MVGNVHVEILSKKGAKMKKEVIKRLNKMMVEHIVHDTTDYCKCANPEPVLAKNKCKDDKSIYGCKKCYLWIWEE